MTTGSGRGRKNSARSQKKAKGGRIRAGRLNPSQAPSLGVINPVSKKIPILLHVLDRIHILLSVGSIYVSVTYSSLSHIVYITWKLVLNRSPTLYLHYTLLDFLVLCLNVWWLFCSAGEEGGLIDYIRGLAVSPRMLEEVRRLLSILVLQGHYSIAHHVQSSLAAYQNDQKVTLESMEKDAEAHNMQAVNLPLANSAAVSTPSSSVAWKLAVLEPPEGL